MSKIFAKKQVLFFGLLVALAAAVYVNWYYTKPMSQIENGVPEQTTASENLGEAQYVNAQNSTYFDAATLKRTKAHDDAKTAFQSVMESSEADEESKKSAREGLQELAVNIKQEADIENLITAKSGGKCLVTIGDSVEVVLEKGTLNDQVAIQIKEIIVNKTDISAEKITLVELK